MSRLWRVLSRYGPLSQLPRKDQLNDHVSALKALQERKQDQDLFDHLYQSLSILDAKSQSLLGFNSLLAAVFAIFMQGDLIDKNRRFAAIGIALTLASSLLLLLVVWVQWSTPTEMSHRTTFPVTLLALRKERTIEYRLGWYLSSLAVLALVFLVGQLIMSPPRPAGQTQTAPSSQEPRAEPQLSAPRR